MTSPDGARERSPDGADDGPQRVPGQPGRYFATSMSLLTGILARPLDPGYEAAARRRADEGAARRSPGSVALLVLLAVGLGVVIVTATQTLRAPQPAVVQARQVLETEVTERSREVAAAQEELVELDTQIQKLQRTALESSDPELLARLATDESVNGAKPLTGPGVRVTLADAAGVEESDSERRVHDSDLRTVVNGLWASGAEAVSVNGIRVTALTAIRSAGQAVLVDLVPLGGPYVVEAIGDPDRLPTRFAGTAAQDHLTLLRAVYDITSAVEPVASLTLPAASSPTLVHATTNQTEEDS